MDRAAQTSLAAPTSCSLAYDLRPIAAALDRFVLLPRLISRGGGTRQR
jgi:hypothetical protein